MGQPQESKIDKGYAWCLVPLGIALIILVLTKCFG